MHEMLSFSISYPDLIKLHHFTDLTQRGDRGWKEVQRHDNFKENSNMSTSWGGRMTKSLPSSLSLCTTYVLCNITNNLGT
jgi:hypothetical protein